MTKIKKLTMTLVALFAMTAGAWAQATFGVQEITADMVPSTWNGDETMATPQDMAALGIDFVEVTLAEAKTWADYPTSGRVTLLHTYSSGASCFYSVDWDGGNYFGTAANYRRTDIYSYVNKSGFKTFITVGPKVTWDAAAKQATFTMPASDVVLTPLYAPVAQWATESEVELLPTAAEGIFAGTTDPIIVEGTVAPGQGTVMYAVTTDATTAPTLAAFSATVPTAENIADDGDTVYVWYYIQGAATPDGQEATAENTFNDSEICATPLEVSVLSNQFDITFNAANANTIENGKATVTVGGTPATVTEGMLEAVKMGSEVKMTAKQGYKFRKVEAKKVAAASIPAGTLSGKFTINASGNQVNFSQGNLQATYNGSSWSWAFATNQWDYIGNAAGNTSINGNGSVSANNVTVDLFGWVGASSTWTGAAQYGISNSTTTNSTSTYGNVAEEALKSDWGNTIGTGWRTLTWDEWKYVFSTRASGSTVNSTSNARYTHATINTDGTGVNGMILFPDGVTIANGEATSWGTINGNSTWGTKCTSAQWTALAAKGCVFLPAAGYRSGSSVSSAGTGGRYWSSSPYTSGVTNAYRVYFISNSLYPASNDNRKVGHSVRLVREVK